MPPAACHQSRGMTGAAQTLPPSAQDSGGTGPPADPANVAPEGWEELRGASDIQFAPVELPQVREREPSWLDRALETVFEALAAIIRPVALFIAEFWWILALVLAAAVLFFLARIYGPLARGAGTSGGQAAAPGRPDWRPDERESLALLEDADRLALEGRYDEATHLLLKRSVGQIAAARPEWVEPSSTARELAALPALPDAARAAFAVVAERVERSLFALRSLDRSDWEAARAAYAEFALARLGGREAA
ncbi:hypothetical protein SAMN04515621_1662 [Erythrobacter sp. HL-111]|nr:MAG: hypothetical protein HLUCCO15_10270 [Erythrobacteraceae bacterium HL-111]SDS48990.1 hypothetical protein SAMN04515621_1662 [Erythrobacter sp. HL-111]